MSNTYFNLANGPLTQDWSTTGLIAADDNWSAVPSIEGYRGDGLAGATGVNPATITGTSTVLDVNANRSDPNTFTTGGVTEFDGIANPTVALQGSGTARAPYLVLYLDATGRQNITLQFDARDIDGSSDNSIQPIAVQYRIGDTGTWINVPTGTTPAISDASTGPSQATLVTPVNLTLTADANGQVQVQLRIITTDAVGSDEWIGIDNIVVASSPLSDTTPPTLVSSSPADEATNVSTASDVVLAFNESVQLGAGDIVVTDGAGDTRTITIGGAPDPDGTVTVSGNKVTINPTADLAAGTAYHVTVANGTIQDTSGNSFAGIGSGGLDFTTAVAQSFSIAATDANKAEGQVGTTPFTFTVTRANPSATATVDWAVTGLGGAGQASAADFSGAVSGTLTFTGAETSKTITLNGVGDLAVEPNEAFSVTLSNPSAGSAITAPAANGTIQNDDVPLTAIYAIQGSGHVSPLVGQAVNTIGVVTAVDTNGSRGFYIQDPNGDGNAATSDGIFVFRPNGTLPEVGHLVRVSGTVQEFTPSGAAVGSLSTTELSSVTDVTDLGMGPAIAPVQIGGPGGLVPPTESLIAGTKFFESLEGMLVTVKNAQATGPTNGFGEIFTVVDNDADPTNGTTATGQIQRGNVLLTPGASDFGDTNASGGDFNPERVQIDDDNGILPGFASPLVNVGARLGDVTGVVNYDFGNYQVVATQAYGVAQPSALAKETGTLTGDIDHLLVASYNAENLDPGDGTARFTTIADQILHNLNAPDVVALQEVQDNNGPTDNGVISADATLQMIVDALNAAAPPGTHYAYIDNPFIGNDSNGGEPGGNIRTAFLYRTDRVDFVAGSLRTIGADGHAISNPNEAAPDGNGDQQTNPDNPFFDSRPPLVATFTFHGEAVTIIDNHFTSKGGSAPLLGADQPPFDAGEVQRAAQAQAVNTFVDTVLASDANARVIVAGDLNEFQFEEPMQVLKGTATVTNYDVPGTDPFDAVADYTPGGTAILGDLQDLLSANERYDYVFEGNSETLDHVFVSNGLLTGAQFDVVRINAEFADQTSDHDPLLARFAIPLNDPPVAVDDAVTVAEDHSIVIAVLANDTDPDHDPLAVSAINGQPFDANGRVVLTNGTVALNADGTLTLTPNANFNGPLSFDYTVTDRTLSDTGTVNVAVTPVDDAPAFTSPASFALPENQTAVGTVAAIDPEHESFSFALAGGNERTFFSIDTHTGALSFLAAPDFETPEDANHDNVYDLIVSATDVSGATSTQAISVNVTNVVEAGRTINGSNRRCPGRDAWERRHQWRQRG
jgi:predicted extracellular nuclease